MLAGLLIVSQLLSGFLQDRFGRKKVITVKALMCLLFLIPLIPFGFMEDRSLIRVSLGFFFMAVLFSTFNFDIMLMGFEKLPKASRVNYVVVMSATRITGIGLLALIFYLTEKWAYFMIVLVAFMAVLVPLFAKYVYESPLHVMTTSGDHDWCKFILNSIAIINQEDIVSEKIYF